jgi:hypothetical protein
MHEMIGKKPRAHRWRDNSCRSPNRPMSALGHKATYAPQKVMSALHPKADMCGATSDVRYGPKADSCTAANSIAIRSPHPRSPAASAHREAECFGSPDVDEMLDGSARHSDRVRRGIGHIGLICASGIRAAGSTGADRGFFSRPPLRHLDESHRAAMRRTL